MTVLVKGFEKVVNLSDFSSVFYFNFLFNLAAIQLSLRYQIYHFIIRTLIKFCICLQNTPHITQQKPIPKKQLSKQQPQFSAMSQQQDKNQLVVEYIVNLTQKLSKTFKQLNQMSVELLKTFTANDRSERYKNRVKEKEKDKNDDLNSNLLNQEDQEINGNAGRKKVKTKNRNQEAEEDVEPIAQEQKAPPKSAKKAEEKNDKNIEQKLQDTKKKQKLVSHKPKAPTSSFLLFFKQQQQSIAKSYPNYGVVQLTKVAAKCWNELSVQEKDPYQKLFEVERKKYQEEMEKYRRQFPEQVKLKQLEKKEKKKKKAKQKRDKEVKQPKQKPAPLVSNDPSLFQNMTPYGGVKLEEPAPVASQEKEVENYLRQTRVKEEESLGQDQLEQIDAESEENSLGSDI